MGSFHGDMTFNVYGDDVLTWATSMPARAQITTRGPPALDSSAWVK